VNANYLPRLDKVGAQASNKIFAADGTRYYDPPRLDFDIAPNPEVYGSFTDSGPIYHPSTAYGRSHIGNPINTKLSFRHPGQRINAVYFDGHAGDIPAQLAWKDATPWYPGGSIYNGGSATPESQAFHSPGDKLP
jgi:prepilin-type processing-associated H-X9-DG protein